MEDKKIVLATGHAHAFHRASVLTAIQNGYFRDEGLLKIELRATGDDSLTVMGLKSRNIDFGLDVRPGLIIEENSKGEKLYIISGMLNALDKTFIGAPDIKSIADLRGKKIGVIEKGGGRDMLWFRMLLRKEGLDPDKDVKWVINAGHGSLKIQGTRLERGDYHATGLSAHNKRPEIFEQLRQAGFNHLAERSKTHPEGLPDRAVAATEEILTRHPLIVKSVLKAIVRGYRFARDQKNAEKVREIYLTYDWGKEGFGWGNFDESLIDGMVRCTRTLPPDGGISKSGLDAIIEEYKVWGKLPPEFNKEQVLRMELLQEAVSELNAKFGTEGY